MKMKAVLGLVFASVLMISSFSVLLVQAWYNSTTPWSQNQHDSQHTCLGTSTAPSSNSTLWTYWSEGDAKARHLVVDSGRVFAVQGGSFFVLDETTGALVGSGTGGGGYGGNIGGAYADGKLYYTSCDYIYNRGTVYCFNATTGSQLWTYDTSPGQIQHAPTVSGNRAYVGTLNNYTYCLEDGVLKWYRKLGGPIYPAPAVDGDLLCVGCDDGILYAFNIAGAQPVSLWNFTVGTAVRSSITIQGDKVYCTSEDGYLYALDRTNGNIIWSWKSQGGYGLTIAVAYGIVYVGDMRPGWGNHPISALYANVTAGNYTYSDPEPRLWSDVSAVYGYHGFAVSGNMLFYQSADSTIYARNALTGVHLWSYQCIYITTVPIIADGHVFCADDRQIYCIGPSYPPVTNIYDVDVGGQTFTVAATTNSTMANLNASTITTTGNMSFTVDSNCGGTGMCNITLPNSMLGEPYAVTVGGQSPWSYEMTHVNETHTGLYFTYNGTGKYVAQITGTPSIPEFPPTISIIAPENKTYNANDTILLTFIIDEAASWMGYSLNGQANTTLTGNTTLPVISDGLHDIVVYANDTFGNMGSSGTVHFTVDTVAPSGSLIINNGGAYTNVTEVDLTLYATDAGSGVSQMRFQNDGDAWSSWEPYATSKSWSLQTGDGLKYVFVQYKDLGGLNVTAYATITLDETEPVANAGQNQTVNAGTLVNFNASSSSDNMGIVSYSWSFGDGATATGATATHTYSSSGTYTTILTVEDAAGNTATNSITITVQQAVIPEISSVLILAALMTLIACMAIAFRKKEPSSFADN